MRVLIVNPSFFPATYYGGPVAESYGLSRWLTEGGHSVRVVTTDIAGPGRRLDAESERNNMLRQGLDVTYYRNLAIAQHIAPGMLSAIERGIEWADVIHLFGLYCFPTIPALVCARLHGKPVFWSTCGGVMPYVFQRRRTLKKIWIRVCRCLAPRNLVMLAASPAEEDAAEVSFPGVACLVVPHGVSMPTEVATPGAQEVLRLLFIGRVDPIKGLENLLRALASMPGRNVQLNIAGTGVPEYKATLEKLSIDLCLQECVRFVGEVSGKVKGELFLNSDILILPSYSENFGRVVAEALSYGLPVIASQGTPWEILRIAGCGLWVDNSPESLRQAIVTMRQGSLVEMGKRARQLAEKQFSASEQRAKVIQGYSEAIAALQIA